MNRFRLWAVIRKEFIQILRDKATLTIILMMPLMMMLMFGYAVNTDVENVDTAVLLQDHSPEARRLIDRFAQSRFYKIDQYAPSEAALHDLIQQGAVKVGIVVPEGYGRSLAGGTPTQVQVLIDGSDPLVARSALANAQLIGQITSTELTIARLQRQAGGLKIEQLVDVRPRVWYNPNLESLKFNMPGLVGLILQNITMILTAFAVVRERERGTMEQLIVTPVTSLELIIGKLVPYVVIAFADVFLVLAVSVFWFGMEIVGSLWLLLGIGFLFLLGALGMGLLVSSISTNQLQAMQMTQLFLLPSILLSGFVFPREAMPPPIYVLGYLIPLTYFLKVLRGIILKGVGLQELWRETLLLGGYGVAILALAMVRLRKKLD